MQDNVSEIKRRLDIAQVLGEYIPLKKAGTSLKAPCPFHHEKTASFYVSADKQVWHCFGCGEGGDMFSFVMKIEGVEFKEALKTLARKAGVELQHEAPQQRSERGRLAEANALAAKFYHQVLLQAAAAESVRAYAAERRGLSPETIEAFSIGYAPDSWDSLRTALRKKGFRDEELLRAGLLSQNERGRIFDRFRHRLMFPIADSQGVIVGFTARVLPGADGKDPADTAKYVNTPQSPLYDKSSVLFCLDKAKQAIRRSGCAVVVEGNMDAIAAHQAGFTNVVASSGTAFTDEQLRLLKRFCSKLVLSFDADAAGENAAKRSIDAAVAAGFSVRMLRLPPGVKDPDECIRKNPDGWKKAVEEAGPYMRWYIDGALLKMPPNDPQAQGAAADGLLAEVAKIPEPVEQAQWIRELSRLFSTPEQMLYDRLRQLRHQAGRPPAPQQARPEAPKAKPAAPVIPKNRWGALSQLAVGMVCRWPELGQQAAAVLPAEAVEPSLLALYNAALGGYAPPDSASAATTPAPSAETDLSSVRASCILAAEKDYGDADGKIRLAALASLANELVQLHRERRKRSLIALMAQAEHRGDATELLALQHELAQLMR